MKWKKKRLITVLTYCAVMINKSLGPLQNTDGVEDSERCSPHPPSIICVNRSIRFNRFLSINSIMLKKKLLTVKCLNSTFVSFASVCVFGRSAVSIEHYEVIILLRFLC